MIKTVRKIELIDFSKHPNSARLKEFDTKTPVVEKSKKKSKLKVDFTKTKKESIEDSVDSEESL